MGRPPFGSPEWLPYFKENIMTSDRATEAAAKMGYRGPGTMRYHMKKFGIPYPRVWSRRPYTSLAMQRHIPSVIIPSTIGRCWVAGLIQGEGCIQSLYRLVNDVTYLQLDVSMVDGAPIYKLSEYYGLPHSMRTVKNHDWRPQLRKNIAGLRALRVLQEILPFLVGQKLQEAERALAFFGPRGIHPGCYRNGDIWPQSEFPLRTKGRGSPSLPTTVARAERVRGRMFGWSSQPKVELSGRQEIPEVIIPSIEDRSWVGGLTQGEGCTQSHYARLVDSTTIELSVSMTDPAPVFKFSGIVGLPRPSKPKPVLAASPNYKPKWLKGVTGLRALRVLKEIRPFLFGEKSREVEKALAFFSPTGYRAGCFRPIEIWPRDAFPLRRRLEA
jgi:hypothetical protein